MFNTHTQASYFGVNLNSFIVTFETRFMQLKMIRQFIERKTRTASPDDLIVLVGDMNANG